MKKIEFSPYDLERKAFDLYSNSDCAFYIDDEGCYWYAKNRKSLPCEKIGTLQDVENYLLFFDC